MSKAVKSVFGGTDRSAQRATQAQNRLSQEFIKMQEGQAQQYLGNAMPGMQEAAAQGFQGAANVLGGAVPQQINALQQGTNAAQQYLLGGMPAFRDALMGTPVNYGQFQPMQNIQFDPSVFQQQVYRPPQGQQPMQQNPMMGFNPLGGMVR